MVQHEGHGFRIEPGVDGIEHRPAMGTPKCASTMGGVLGSMTATVSFLPMPLRRSALASWRQRA